MIRNPQSFILDIAWKANIDPQGLNIGNYLSYSANPNHIQISIYLSSEYIIKRVT